MTAFVWIPIAITSAFLQAVRTAAQKELNDHLSVIATTYVRALFGLPVMIVYLGLVLWLADAALPTLSLSFLVVCLGAAATQVIATALLIHLFTLKNFAVGTMLSKTEVILTAIVGSLLFSESISTLGWLAIAFAVVGVILLSLGRISQWHRAEGRAEIFGEIFFQSLRLSDYRAVFFLPLPTSWYARRAWSSMVNSL